MNDTLLNEDKQARAQALDSTRSFIVQAPAGSGKTTVLTARLLNLLLCVEEPEEILAITFTRKAAAEMLARVVALLRPHARPEHAHEIENWELARRVRERSQQRGWALEQSVNRLRIQTIDALNFWIASQLPASAGIGGQLKVTDDALELYQQAAQSMLTNAERDAELGPHVERLLSRADQNWSRLIGSFAQLLPLRAHWLAHLQDSSEALLERVRRSLHDIADDALQELGRMLDGPLRALAANVVTRAAQHLSADSAPCLDQWRAQPVLLTTDRDHLLWWQELARLLLLKDGDGIRKALNVGQGVPKDDLPLKQDAKALMAQLHACDGLLQALSDVAALPALELTDDAAQALRSIAVLLRHATAELQLSFAAAGRVDHVYIAGAARQALLSAGDPSELALRLGNRLRHILVDEFQDTSIRQLQTLELLTADWQPGDGRTLFLVGDPMQSIYLFRETDVGLFLQAARGRLGSVPLQPLQLRQNFRSRPALVDFANRSFSALFPDQPDARYGAVTHLTSVAARSAPGTGGVQMHCLAPQQDAEAICVREIVTRQLQRNPAVSIAVLVRSRQHALPITRQLLAAGISVEGVDLLPLSEVGVVQDLAALTRALRHDGDRIAWAAVLRSPYCGLTLADLEVLLGGAPNSTVRELLSQPERLAALSVDGQQRLERVRHILNDPQIASDQLPGVQALEEVWRALGGPAACQDVTELSHARRYFDELAQRVMRDGWPEPDELERVLKKLYAEPVTGTVQIMTIHKAKGLEFDLVILPGLNRSARGDEPALLRWVELPRADPSANDLLTDLLVAPMTPAVAEHKDPLYQFIDRLRKHREEHEKLRLWYVAITRAREALHLVASVNDLAQPAPRAHTALALLWPAIGADFSAALDTPSDSTAPQRSAPVPLRRLPAHWRQPLLTAGVQAQGIAVARIESAERPQFIWVAELGRQVGTAVHAQLQRAGSQPLKQFSDELAAAPTLDAKLQSLLIAQGLDASLAAEGARRVAAALQSTLADPRGRWILGGAHRDARSEFALSGLFQGRLTQAVIDRWLIDDTGQCWVIDYKTSAHQGGDIEEFLANELRRYAPQLRRYCALARGLTSQRVRAALYFPLLARFVELPETETVGS